MAIKVSDLFYVYNPKSPNATEALNGVSFTIEDNSFVAFVGETVRRGLLHQLDGQAQHLAYCLHLLHGKTA